MSRDFDSEIELAAELAAHKVAPLFNLFQWTYGCDIVSPTIHKLESDIKEMIYSLQQNEGDVQQRGRLIVQREPNDETYDYRVVLDLAGVFGLPK